MKKVKKKVLRPTHANVGIENTYRRELQRIVLEMCQDVTRQVVGQYVKNPPRTIAEDKAPVNTMVALLTALLLYWMKRFTKWGVVMAPWMVEQTARYVDNSMQNGLAELQHPVKFRPSPAHADVISASIAENVSLIRSIPMEYFQAITQIVTDAMAMGKNGAYLAESLTKKFGVEERRAKNIARDQINKATASLVRERQMQIGIKEAYWLHSHAGEVPRPDHLAYDGKKYNIEEGALISGKYINPGQLPNCRCVSRSILPELGD